MTLLTGLIAGAIGGLAGALVSAAVPLIAERRAQHDRVLSLIAECSQKPIAYDRHRVGSILHRAANGETPKELVVDLLDEEVAAFFRVLWYFERVDAMYQSLRSRSLQKLLVRSLSSAISTWNDYADETKYELWGYGKERVFPGQKAIPEDAGRRRVDMTGRGPGRGGSPEAVRRLAQELDRLAPSGGGPCADSG